jgi:hypothetical protein
VTSVETLPSPHALVQSGQAGQDLDEEDARFLIGRDPQFIGFGKYHLHMYFNIFSYINILKYEINVKKICQNNYVTFFFNIFLLQD